MVAITIIAIMVTMELDEIMPNQQCEKKLSAQGGCDENYTSGKAKQNPALAFAVTRHFFSSGQRSIQTFR